MPMPTGCEVEGGPPIPGPIPAGPEKGCICNLKRWTKGGRKETQEALWKNKCHVPASASHEAGGCGMAKAGVCKAIQSDLTGPQRAV